MVKIAKDFATVAALYARKYSGKTILVKFGGEIVSDETALAELLKEAITLKNLGANIILLHGGGTQITEQLKKADLFEEKIDGVRPTSSAALDITQACLTDLTRKVVNELHRVSAELGADVKAVGLGCNDGGLVMAQPHSSIPNSRTGEVSDINPAYLNAILAAGQIVVLNPICLGQDGGNFNVNADDVASALGKALKVARLIFMSDTFVYDANKKRIDKITPEGAERLIADGVIQGGMIPKIRGAVEAVEAGVGGVVILNGKDPNALRTEILTDEGAGTLVTKNGVHPSANPSAPVLKTP